jgi:hypothetical protein
VAFVVCKAVGLQTGTSSADYIQLWRRDANLLRESPEVVQQTAAVILGGIAPKPEVRELDSHNPEPDSTPFSPPQMAESPAAKNIPF